MHQSIGFSRPVRVTVRSRKRFAAEKNAGAESGTGARFDDVMNRIRDERSLLAQTNPTG